MAQADLWVYNAEIFCVSFFNQVTIIFHLRGGKIKKSFFWAYLVSNSNFQKCIDGARGCCDKEKQTQDKKDRVQSSVRSI